MKNEVKHQFYTTSKTAWEAMLQGIESAKKTIEIEQFIFQNDKIGNTFIDALKKKAKEGIKIRILADALGSRSLYKSKTANELKKLGIEIEFFNHLLPWKTKNITLWYFRDHRKILIIDDLVSYIGGVCIGDEMTEWNDTHIMIEDEAVTKSILEAFNKVWLLKESFTENIWKQTKMNKNYLTNFDQGVFVTNTPVPGRRYLYRTLLKLIRTAKSEIVLTTPYFAPNFALEREIVQASARGVKVKIMVPEYSNEFVVDAAFRSYVNHLLRENVEVYQYKRMHHGKTAIFDNKTIMIGSLNLDNISLRYNLEASLIIKNEKMADNLKKIWTQDIASAVLITKENWKKRGAVKKFFEIIIRPLRGFL